MKTKKLYAVLLLNYWKTALTTTGKGNIGDEYGSCGFIRVFDDEKKMKKAFPKATCIQIATMPQ